MASVLIPLLVALGLALGTNSVAAEAANCSALLQKRDAECQVMAEKMETACSGEKASATGEQSAECRRLGAELANHCNRNPCRPAPKKGKAKKGKAKNSSMKSSKAKAPAKK
jgi:hypothetical protein